MPRTRFTWSRPAGAVLESGGDRIAVRPGSVIYVPAGEVHRFGEIVEDLAAIVVFAPAEYSRARA